MSYKCFQVCLISTHLCNSVVYCRVLSFGKSSLTLADLSFPCWQDEVPGEPRSALWFCLWPTALRLTRLHTRVLLHAGRTAHHPCHSSRKVGHESETEGLWAGRRVCDSLILLPLKERKEKNTTSPPLDPDRLPFPKQTPFIHFSFS